MSALFWFQCSRSAMIVKTLTTHRRLVITAAALLAIGFVLALINPVVTRYIEGPEFRRTLEQETARGLHFGNCRYAPIRRTGLLRAGSDSFQARDGRKAITALDARDITGRFNPFAVFLRRWQIDDLQIDRGEIGIQVYEPTSEPKPVRPWFQIFLPSRVYLKRVLSDDVDVTWPMRGRKGGVFHTHLLITPHGRDFEYHANGGTLRNPLMPEVAVRGVHLLITKTLFALYNLDLNSGGGTIHAEGTAAVRGERRVDFSFNWNELPVREWIPEGWTGNYAGVAAGDLHWTGHDYKFRHANMAGVMRVTGGRVSGLQLLDQIAAVTNKRDLAQLDLDECRARFRWQETDCELSEIALEQRHKFRIEGNVAFGPHSLGGTLQIGVAPDYLDWLPRPDEVFRRRSGGYLWTTVHLSGTPESPRQDLSPRLLAALTDSPGALLGAALRAFAAWLREK